MQDRHPLPFNVLPTPYGGRGAFSTTAIPEGTIILACQAPYASVVMRKFRKEVCAWCFKYAFEHRRNSWGIRVEGAGVWLCSNECRDAWVANDHGTGLRVALNAVLEKFLGKRDNKRQRTVGADPIISPLAFLKDLKPEDITEPLLDRAWVIAEDVYAKHNSAPTDLDELELDTAHFVLEGLITKTLEESVDHIPFSNPAADASPYACSASAGVWADLLELQGNELPFTKAKSYLLASHIKVFGFLKQVVIAAYIDAMKALRAQPSSCITPGMLTQIERLAATMDRMKTIMTAENVRAILGRDHGNVFGIWDMVLPGEESEMLGWGMYVFGSYFNHDCTPNIVKSRSGRSMHFTTLRPVEQGEELSISYVDVTEGTAVSERRRELGDWFFTCGCSRCTREAQVYTGDTADTPST